MSFVKMRRMIVLAVILFIFKHSDAISSLVCDSTWTKVLQTDSSGNVETGSKSTLIDAVLHGAQLQVFVSNWEYASSTQQINFLKNETELCAQAIFHISKDSWKSFHDDAYWYFLLLCTSGYIEKARWYVGTHAQPSSVDTSADTTSRERIVWFVRGHTYGSKKVNPVYCNSNQGVGTCGSLRNLAETVTNGADIRAVDTSFISLTPFNHVAVSKNGDLISGQYLWSISETNMTDHNTFIRDAYWWFSIWSTSGLLDMSRWSIGSHIDRSHTSTNTSINWYADTCWMLAYNHNKNGSSLDGSLEFLRSAIMNGHRVKLVMGNYSIETDNLLIRNGEVSGQLLGHVSKTSIDHFAPNGYWYWNHISTTGEGETIRYDVGSATDQGSSNYTTSASWFIDTRHWKHVLSTSSLGMAVFGSKTDLVQYIREGSMLRCIIRFSQEHVLVAQADNVEFSPDGTNVGAQILRIISYTTEETTGRHFETIPYWKFTIAATDGTVHQSDWVVGEHTSREADFLIADIDWFVN